MFQLLPNVKICTPYLLCIPIPWAALSTAKQQEKYEVSNRDKSGRRTYAYRQVGYSKQFVDMKLNYTTTACKRKPPYSMQHTSSLKIHWKGKGKKRKRGSWPKNSSSSFLPPLTNVLSFSLYPIHNIRIYQSNVSKWNKSRNNDVKGEGEGETKREANDTVEQ